MIGDTLSYLYVNAKIMAKEGKFISPSRWEDLWGCSSPGEIASLLEGTDYFPFLSEGAVSDAIELEKSVLEEFSALGREISTIIPKGSWPIKEYLLKRWDIVNLRTLMRGIHGAAKKRDAIADSLIDGGELDVAFLRTLIEAESMDDFVARLAKTPYQSLIDGLGKYNETKNLFFLEASLDRIFWTDIWFKVLKIKGMKEFREFIRVCVETHNLKIILRAKNDGLLLEDITPFLIPDCATLNALLSAFDEEDLSDFIPLLEDTLYYEPLLSAQQDYEKIGSILAFEQALDNVVVKKAGDIRKKKPFGSGPLVGFLVAKDKEVQDLLTIVRSTEVDLEKNEIREALARK
jgi:V/A-type H+-transporting ATPase subunit C